MLNVKMIRGPIKFSRYGCQYFDEMDYGITFGQVWLIKCQPWLWKEMITKATKNQFNFHMLILLHQVEQNKGWKKIQY